MFVIQIPTSVPKLSKQLNYESCNFWCRLTLILTNQMLWRLRFGSDVQSSKRLATRHRMLSSLSFRIESRRFIRIPRVSTLNTQPQSYYKNIDGAFLFFLKSFSCSLWPTPSSKNNLHYQSKLQQLQFRQEMKSPCF